MPIVKAFIQNQMMYYLEERSGIEKKGIASFFGANQKVFGKLQDHNGGKIF